MGCASKGPGIARSTVQRLAGYPYPESALHGRDLDVVLIRDGKTIRVVNREPEPVRFMQLWLNQTYVREIDTLPVGESSWSLAKFINDFEESYPTGGVLSPDKSRTLLIAEFYDPKTGNIHRLLTQPDKPAILPI